MIHNWGFTLSLHYLDNFLFLGHPNSPVCSQALSSTLQIYNELGVQIDEEKMGGPVTVLSFLHVGIMIDTELRQLCLPQDKLRNLTALCNKWMPCQSSTGLSRCTPSCTSTKRKLLSLIGLLNLAAIVVRPGRTFLRRLIFHLDHHVTLQAQARAWWYTFIHSWNGNSMMPPEQISHTVYTDASAS